MGSLCAGTPVDRDATMALPIRPMGKQGLMASMQGFGTMGLAAFYGPSLSDDDAVGILEQAYAGGITHFDSAEVYQGKDSEGNPKNTDEFCGKFLKKVGRKNVTVASKYMPRGSDDKVNCAEEEVRKSLDGILQRMDTDYLDLFYLHRITTDEALANWMEASKKLVAEGKVKYLGLSEATPAQIRLAHAISPLTAIQQEWSMLIRNLEDEVVPTCRELGIAIVAYSPMCRGLTSGLVKKAEDWSLIGNAGGAATGFQSMCPYTGEANTEHNASLLEPMIEKAKELDVSPAQLSVAWVHAQGEDVFPIPGTTKVKNLQTNIGAAKLALTLQKDMISELSQKVDYTKVKGDRYPEYFIGMCFDKK
eukprot:gnl/MRDRNA2_/MRDRNA2_28207_c0_seq2.p1 gnl/MRDRNA2_/MRDRNA2_28207_c0~~gnl/MRDRNA2_/MRDRNA2_28207_c0_seq2.p1  ORF type:complete len:363 (-),score=85.85 gnl/MRDRNA2_/MRDRNA2_28207_c0_seq2:254-1342(-)